MLKKLVARLKRVLKNLSLTNAKIAYARSQVNAHHERAVKAHDRAVEARHKADRLLAQGRKRAAAQVSARAQRRARRAQRHHDRSQEYVAQVKRLVQKRDKLATTEAELRAKIKKLKGVTIKGNTATGGNREQRLAAVALASAAACAAGHRTNFYSQPGYLDLDHVITGEPHGARSDCSSWFTSVYKACGEPDPNGGPYGGTTYTGSLFSGGHRVDAEHARNHAGVAVLYGNPTHHVEFSLGDGTEHTIGHGSAPIDMGSFYMLSGPVTFVAYD